MTSLSIIFEDMEDGTVQIKCRSTKELPTDLAEATPAEIILAEVSGHVATTYNIKEGGIIDLSNIITLDKPKLIV